MENKNMNKQDQNPSIKPDLPNDKASKKPKNNSRWKQILMHRGWDYGLAILLLLLSAFFTYMLYHFPVFSEEKTLYILLLVLFLNLTFLILLCVKKITWFQWCRRLLVLVLCGLLAFLNVSFLNAESALEQITEPQTETMVNVSVITQKSNTSLTFEALKKKRIGIQIGNDKANADYVKEQLEKEELNVSYVESINYATLYQDLLDNKIDALIISDTYFNSLLRDTFPTIKDDIQILKTYQKAREVDINRSGKDIRKEPFVVYVAGVDEGEDVNQDARYDVNILLFVNPLENKIEMVSIPRDTFVPNPALFNENDKLTHLGLNGMKNSITGIENVFKVDIDYYVKLNFFSVIEIIDALGKIEVDVPAAFCEQDENRSFDSENLICLEQGVQNISGKQALAFARHRKTYGDVMRGMAQQEVIKGIINTLTTPSGAANINNVMKIAPKYISTNMPMEQITNFISLQLDNLRPWSISSILLENSSDASLLTASIPELLLSVQLLNTYDAQLVYDAYQRLISTMQFQSFNFDLNNLEESNARIPLAPGVLWADNYIDPNSLLTPIVK